MPSELIYYELRNFIYVLGKNVFFFFLKKFKLILKKKSLQNSLLKIFHLKLLTPQIVNQRIINNW